MNIRTFLSGLAIIAAFFIGGVMTFIDDHTVWSYILWGLGGILLIITLIYYFKQRPKKPNPNIRWL